MESFRPLKAGLVSNTDKTIYKQKKQVISFPSPESGVSFKLINAAIDRSAETSVSVP